MEGDTGTCQSSMLSGLEKREGDVVIEPCQGEGVPTRRLFRTCSLYMSYLCKGLVIAILGAALLDIESQTGCSSQEAALLLTWSSLGRLPGSLLAAIIFDRLAPELQLLVAVLIMGIVVLALPWITNYAVLSTVIFLQGICIGYMGGGCNSYCFALWRDRSAPIIQGLHFTLSVGCSLAPLLASPFLSSPLLPGQSCTNVSLPGGEDNQTCYLGLAREELLISAANPELESAMVYEEVLHMRTNHVPKDTYHELNINLQSDTDVEPYTNNVPTDVALPSNLFYPCLIVLGIMMVSMVIGLVIFVQDKCLVRRSSQARLSTKSDFTIRHAVYIALFAVFFFCLGGLEVTYGGLLVTFTVRALHWEKSSGMYVTTLYWVCIACGRGLGIILTRLLRSEVIIAIDVIMTTLSVSVLAVAYDVHPLVTWICSAVYGLAIATGIVNGLVICSKTLQMSSKLASFLMGSVFAGMMIVPALTGYVIRITSPVFLVYTMLGVSLLFLLTCAVIFLYTRYILHGTSDRYRTVKVFTRGDSSISTTSCESSSSDRSTGTTVSYSSEDDPFLDQLDEEEKRPTFNA